MSNPVSLQKPTVPQLPLNPPAEETSSFLQGVKTVAKVVLAILSAIGGIAAFAVGITLIPFVKEGGVAAFATGTALFGASGALIYNR